ncbi:MAG TPA: nucleoside 2-deoxyribosyltransferase, partial [Bacteroidota bacterium]|nr:nucleoside 2-deoxyribosyltransferase [Bacteroidota bacterium]
MKPDISQLIANLRRQPSSRVPNVELGVHPVIKERFLGRPVVTLADDVEFWHRAGYDYIKLQPGVDFDPARIATDRNLKANEEGTVVRKWASEGSGVIASWEDLERYVFPRPEDLSYERFDEVRALLPPGMGVIGQYGDIFTMTWEMMGF